MKFDYQNVIHQERPQLGRSWFDRCIVTSLGVPERQYGVLKSTDSGEQLKFQTVAIWTNSMAFGLTSALFSYTLMRNGLLDSILIGSIAGAALFAIDRQTLINLRVNPQGGRGMAWTVRISTIAMALMISILGGVQHHKEDIARLQAANAKAVAETALANGEFAPLVKVAQSSIDQATKDAAREAELRTQLTKAKGEEAKAESELENELKGAYDPTTGIARPLGDGPKAKYWDSVRVQTAAEIRAAEKELSDLGDVSKRQADAQKSHKALTDTALTKATLQQEGAARKLEILFQLLSESWAAWLTLGFGFFLGLLPECMLLLAMAPSTCLRRDYVILNQIETQRSDALAFRMAHEVKAEIAASSKPSIVRMTTTAHKGSWSPHKNTLEVGIPKLAGAISQI